MILRAAPPYKRQHYLALITGTIQPADLKLKALDFCAVNFHPNDNLATRSKFSPEVNNIETDMQSFQTRTVFIAQADAILKFLDWPNTYLTTGF